MEANTKRIFKNLTALGFVQVTNYVLPLLTIPYLIRILGVEKFGLVSLAQAILLYMIILPDYGFNLTTTKKIAINRQLPGKLDLIVSTTLLTKTFLLIVAFISLAFLLSVSSYLDQHKTLFMYGFSIVIGQTYFPMWFFQGIEKLKFITLLNLLSRVLLTLLIFILIKVPSNYILVIPIYATGLFISSIAGLLIMFIKFRIKLVFPGFRAVGCDLWEGFPLFVSSLATNTYVSAGIIIAGLFTTPTMTGYYAIADKVLLVFRQSAVVVSQAIYPTMCIVREEGGDEKVWNLIKSVFKPLLLLFGLAAAILFSAPSTITQVLTGESIMEVETIIKIFSPLPLIIITGMILNQFLLTYDFRKESMFVSLFTTIFSLAASSFAAIRYEVFGLAASTLITEIIMVILYTYITKNTTLLKNWRVGFR